MPIIGNNGTPSIFDPKNIRVTDEHPQKADCIIRCDEIIHKAELEILASVDIFEVMSERSGKVSNLNPQDAKDRIWYEYSSMCTSPQSNAPAPSDAAASPKAQGLPCAGEFPEIEPQTTVPLRDTACASHSSLTKDLLQNFSSHPPLETPRTYLRAKITFMYQTYPNCDKVLLQASILQASEQKEEAVTESAKL